MGGGEKWNGVVCKNPDSRLFFFILASCALGLNKKPGTYYLFGFAQIT